MSDEGYALYRGKCKEYAEKEIEKDPTLTLVRGFYHCPLWGKEHHFWCKKPDGTIVDPTVTQFPTEGVGAEYEEYDGIVDCEECGKRVAEEDATIDGHHVFCSGRCHASCIGMLEYYRGD